MAAVGTVTAVLTLDAAQFVAGLAAAGSKLAQLGSSVTSLGAKLSAAVSLPLGAASTAAVKFATDFDAKMTQLVTLVGVNEKEMQNWRKSILDLAPAVAVGPNKLADAMYIISSAGFRGAAALDILSTSAKASAVGLGDTATVANTVTSVVRAYGEANISASRAAEVLIATVAQGKVPADELAGSLGKVIAIAAEAGVSFEQVGAFVASFTRLGVDANIATTSLRTLLVGLTKPTSEAALALKSVGLSSAQLREEVQSKGLVAALTDLVARFHGNFDAMEKVIPEARALAGALAVAGAQGDQSRQILDNITHSTGSLEDAFRRSQSTFQFTFSQFAALAESTAIKFGDRLAPALVAVLQAIEPLAKDAGDLADAFAQLAPSTQQIALGALGLAIALPPVLLTMGGLVLAAGAVGTAFAGAAAIILPALPELVVGILGLAAVGTILVEDWNRMKLTGQRLWLELKADVLTAIADMLEGIDRLTRSIPGIGEAMQLAAASARLAALDAADAVKGFTAGQIADLKQLDDELSKLPLLYGDIFGVVAQGLPAAPPPTVTPPAKVTGTLGTSGIDEKALADAQKKLAAGLREVRGEALLLGPSFDAAGKEAEVLETGMRGILAAGVSPLSPELQQLANRMNEAKLGTAEFHRQLELAGSAGAFLGDETGVLREQISKVEDRMRFLFNLLDGNLSPALRRLAEDELTHLQAQLGGLKTSLHVSETFDSFAAQAQDAADSVGNLSRELDQIAAKNAALRDLSPFGSTGTADDIAERAARAREVAANAHAQGLTGPNVDNADQLAAMLTKAQEVADGIRSAFTTVADDISSAFSQSVQGIIQGTITLRQAFANLGQSIVLDWASSLVKFVAQTVAHAATERGIWAAQQLGLTAIEQSGAATRAAIRTGEAAAAATAKTAEVGAHVAGEAAKTTATATGSSFRLGFTLREIATTIAEKIGEVAVWVSGETAKLAASAATFGVAIAGTLELVAATLRYAVAIAGAIVSMIAMAILTPTIAGESLVASAAIIGLAAAYKSLAISAAAASVAQIPYVGGFIAPAAAASTGAAIAAAEAIPTIAPTGSAAGGAVLPRDAVIMAHADEMILPAKLSRGVQALIDSYPALALGASTRTVAINAAGAGPRDGATQTRPVHVTIHATDARSFMDLARNNRREFTKMLREAFNDFDPAFR
jgi:TP901 family phage tail tape measure protein